MAKIAAIVRYNEPTGEYSFNCPGCEHLHVITTIKPQANGAIWTFNGNLNKPTFSPSINSAWGKYADPKWQEPEGEGTWSGRCHFFIKDGIIQFCGDSTHSLKGKTVELPEL